MSIEIAIATLIGGNIYPAALPQKPVYPAVTYQAVTGNTDYSFDGPSGLVMTRMQLDLYANSYADIIMLKRSVMAALSGFRGPVGSPPLAMVYGAFHVMERDEFQEDMERAGPRVWRKSLDFNIWHKEEFQ